MKITAVETFTVDGGTHPWQFCAVRTDAGLTGYSEIGTETILRGIEGLVRDFGERLIGRDPGPIERIYTDLYRLMWQARYGATLVAIAGIEWPCGTSRGRPWGCPSTPSSAARRGSDSASTGRTWRAPACGTTPSSAPAPSAPSATSPTAPGRRWRRATPRSRRTSSCRTTPQPPPPPRRGPTA